MKLETQNGKTLLPTAGELDATAAPEGVDRRAFKMRSAVIGATAVISGCSRPEVERAAPPPAQATPPQPASQVSPDLDVVKKSKGPVMTTLEEFYNRRVDLDTTVEAMALTAREMNSKYNETSGGGLAVSLVLC
jgi:L-serine dehydratase